MNERSPKEVHLQIPAMRSAVFTAPTLMALGAANAWTAQVTEDYAALPTALCFFVCAAGWFGEGLLQRGYHPDREVLAYIAVHPGAVTPHFARAVAAPSVSWPATSTASPASGYRSLSPMACPRSPLVLPGRLTEAEKRMRGRLP